MTSRKASLLASVGAAAARLLVTTLRFRVQDRAGIIGTTAPRAIGLFWHNRMVVIPYLMNRYLRGRKGSALTSASKDGEVLAALLQCFEVKAVRGSSSRRGGAAMWEMKGLIEDGYDVAITPDGPRGPCYRLSAGPIKLAQATGAKILPIRVRYSRCWRLRSWDAFQIPKPFATVDLTLMPFETIPPTANAEAFERERARVEAVLRDGQVDADWAS